MKFTMTSKKDKVELKDQGWTWADLDERLASVVLEDEKPTQAQIDRIKDDHLFAPLKRTLKKRARKGSKTSD